MDFRFIGSLFISQRWSNREFHWAHAVKSLPIIVLHSLCPLVLGRYVRSRNVSHILWGVTLPLEDRRLFGSPGIDIGWKGDLRLVQFLHYNDQKGSVYKEMLYDVLWFCRSILHRENHPSLSSSEMKAKEKGRGAGMGAVLKPGFHTGCIMVSYVLLQKFFDFRRVFWFMPK